MTGRELTMAAIAGRPHPRVPVAQHNFTFCARQAGVTMDQYRRDPKLAARVLADAAYQFGYDCIIIDLDPSSVLSQGTKQRVLDASRQVLELAKAKTWKFVLCPGCLANADVPPENIRAMTEAAAQWGHYDQPPQLDP